MSRNLGGDFDDFLHEEHMHEVVIAAALKRVFTWQLSQAMKAHQINKTKMAKRIQTSRTIVNRLLNADDTSVMLAMLVRASVAVGMSLKVEMVRV